jgi:TatD DNase family protein
MTDALWIDSHAHLTMFDDAEVTDVLERASAAGVGGVLVPATGADDLDRTLGLARHHPDRVVAAAGVHPHEARDLDDGLKRRIAAALTSPGVVAVGEIGLDYHYLNSPREDQIAALDWQLDLAIDADLPVVLHNRESWDDLVDRLAARRGRIRGVCHSFTESPDAARTVQDLGLVVGISGMVTFRRADNIREMAAAVSPSRAMVETDSPYLAPVPHRGKRNEPAFVPHVGRELSKVWGQEVAEIAALTTACFRSLFALPATWPRPDGGTAATP